MLQKKYLILFLIVIVCGILFWLETRLLGVFQHTMAGRKIAPTCPTANTLPTDYNGGLTIKISVSSANDPSIYPPDFDIVVLNHTDEPICFENKGFDLAVFWADGNTKEWKEVTLHPSPEDFPSPVTLDAHTESWTGNNGWILHGADLNPYYHWNPLEAYVGGIGQVSGTHYIAYVDIPVIEKPAFP